MGLETPVWDAFEGVRVLARCAELRGDAAALDRLMAGGESGFVVLWRGRVLVEEGSTQPRAELLDDGAAKHLLDSGARCSFLGQCKGRPFFSLELDGGEDSPGLPGEEKARFVELRWALPSLSALDAEVLLLAKGLYHWHKANRFCGVCGSPTVGAEGGHMLRCTSGECGREHFPRTDPAVITAVTYGDRCLLGRQAAWPEGVYSTLAGFVEPGESLEDTVRREVLEEAGVKVGEVGYWGSQPWPFPASLMIGFMANAESEEICLDNDELEDARWFTREALRLGLAEGSLGIPAPVAISFRLIERWYNAGDEGSLREAWRDNWRVERR